MNMTQGEIARIWIWGVVLVCLVAFGFLQLHLQRDYRARQDAWLRAQAELDRRDNLAFRRASDIFFRAAARRDALSIEDARRELNGGRPFPLDERGNQFWTDPASGGRAVVEVHAGMWAGVDRMRAELPGRPNPNLGAHGQAMIGGRMAYVFGYLAFAGMLVVWLIQFAFLAQRARMTRALDLLGVAVVSTALAMLGPTGLRAWRLFNEDDSAGWGLVAIGVALAALIASSLRRQRGDAMQCACGYNLTGNVSGRCPECGAEVQLPAQAPCG